MRLRVKTCNNLKHMYINLIAAIVFPILNLQLWPYTLHDFFFAKVVNNIAFKSHSPTCYVSKS